MPDLTDLSTICARPLPADQWCAVRVRTQAEADAAVWDHEKNLVLDITPTEKITIARWTEKPAKWIETCKEQASEYAASSQLGRQRKSKANPDVCADMIDRWLDSYESEKKRLAQLVIVRGLDTPLHPDWVRAIRDQCAAAGVEFCFAGWGEFIPMSEYSPFVHGFDESIYEHQFCWSRGESKDDLPMSCYRIGSALSGRTLDGREWR